MEKANAQLISALIVSDNHIMRSGLRRILESQSNILLLGEASVGSGSTVETLVRQHPDVILMDLGSHGIDALEFLRNVRKASKNSVFLVLINLGDDELARKALSLGATGVVLKEQPPSVLIAAIQGLCGRNDHHSEPPRVEPVMVATNRSEPIQEPIHNLENMNSLTTREREVIRLIAIGLKNKDVAGRLHISDITVRHHLTSIFSKLKVSDRQKLLIWAHRSGLVEQASRPEHLNRDTSE